MKFETKEKVKEIGVVKEPLENFREIGLIKEPDRKEEDMG